MKIRKGDVVQCEHFGGIALVAVHDGEMHDTQRTGGVCFFCPLRESFVVLEYSEHRRVIDNVGGDQW